MNKKTILFFGILLIFFGLGASCHLAMAVNTTYTPMEKIPGMGNTTDFVSYVKGIYKFGIWTIGIAALLMIMIGGFMYMTSAGNNATMGKAKGYITDAIIGLVMAMTAYLLLATINPDLVNISIRFPSGTGGAGAMSQAQMAQIQADCTKKCTDAGGGENVVNKCISDCIAQRTVQGDPDQYKSNGRCNPAAAGPCTPENLQSTFGSQAQQASVICAYESAGGNPGRASTSDRCRDGNSFSWGLFQLNLTQHRLNGLDCPSAFSGKNSSCTVVNQELYSRCVTAAKDPNINISKAKEIYSGRPNWEDWRNTRNACMNKM